MDAQDPLKVGRYDFLLIHGNELVALWRYPPKFLLQQAPSFVA